MDKRLEIAQGKKKQGEEDRSYAGENITPLARRAAARPAAVRTAALQAADGSVALAEKTSSCRQPLLREEGRRS